MKVRPYERSTLWRSAFAKRRNDPDERDREALADAYRQLRDRAGILVGEIHAALPHLTVHDLTHADTLWDVASEVCGPECKLNPLEGFVLGASFLLHDAGMALAAYPDGLAGLKMSLEWRDAVVSAWKQKSVEDPSDEQRRDPDANISDDAIFQVLRAKHASQAKLLATTLWTQPSTGRPLALVQNDDLLESYGLLIGNIAASHHWPLPEIARYFGDATPASAAWPREWEVDTLLLACILRTADACAIDETRAPSFLFAIRRPAGESKRHWVFQNKIYPAKRRDDSLTFESKGPFPPTEADDWWLCFDAIDVADRELRGVDALLSDRKRKPFAARRVMGAGDPDVLLNFVKVEGWRPVNTLPKISDPSSIIERLGGKQLYGDDPTVPIRELIQNSVDAIRARRFVDPRFAPEEDYRYPGRLLVELSKIEGGTDCWIAVEDNGVGMSEHVITKSLLDFGTSFWSSAAATQLYPGLPSEKRFKPVGKFGIGFFSVFMYSDVVVVMSRAFGSAPNTWNVLTFSRGVRGRGNFSVEGMPTEVASPDATTRIKFRVDQKYIAALAEHSDFGDEINDSSEMQAKRIIEGLKVLSCALDVRVQLRLFGAESISLNQPLIYERQMDEVWNVVTTPEIENLFESMLEDDEEYLDNQKEMLSTLGGRGDPFYGFCGLSLRNFPNMLIKSVGGIGVRAYYGESEPIAGIAEYSVTTASRKPNKLTAPQHVIERWAREQIERTRRLSLTTFQQEKAWEHLGELVDDARDLFVVETSDGLLKLEDFVSLLVKRAFALVPGSGRQIKYGVFHAGIPHIEHEFVFRVIDMNFRDLVLFPTSGALLRVKNQLDNTLCPIIDKPTYKHFWDTVLNTLKDRGVKFQLSVVEQCVIGNYVGLDSPRHGVKSGQEVRSDALKIEIV